MTNTIKILSFTIFIASVTSCSDNLSNSKAEKIIKECIEKQPYRKTVKFQYGERTIFNKDKQEFEKLLELEKGGLLKIDSLGRKNIRYYGKYSYYDIQLLDKSKEHIINQTESNNKRYVELLAFEYEVDEVKEVHEIPSLNAAEVKVNYKKVNITPFSILSSENTTDFKIRKLTFAKTSNGWRYCE